MPPPRGLPVDVLKERQARIGVEIADAKRLLSNAATASEEVYTRLETIVQLLAQAESLYRRVGPKARELLNAAMFSGFKVDQRPDAPNCVVVADAPLTPMVDAVLAYRDEEGLEVENARTPSERKLARGSNVDQLAEREGFEPSLGLAPH